MNSNLILITSAACGVVLLVLVGVFIADDEAPAPAEEDAEPALSRLEPAPAVEPVVVPPPAVEPEVEESVEEVAPEPEPEPDIASEPAPEAEAPPAEPEPPALPDLNTSDPFVQEQISDMVNADAILQHLAETQVIRKFAVLIDGMSRGEIPSRNLPVMPPQAGLAVSEQGEEFYRLDPASYERFNPLVDTFTAMNTEQAVASYRLMAPLFERAFAELGYPGRSFASSLQEAIDNVLAAQVPEREILLTRPSVNYRFADPGLESLTDLEKLLIRMGPDNAAKVQQKVREINTLLADQAQ